MKQMVQRLLFRVIIITVLFSMVLNYCIQSLMMIQDINQAADRLFVEVQQLLEDNQTALNELVEDHTDRCLRRARIGARILEDNPAILESPEEIARLVDLLDVDELHAFDAQGTLFAGSVPSYHSMSMADGGQIGFFSAMLKDRSLELCQEITPNTAEGKLMQYAAVWTENADIIVQIGLIPQKVMEVTKRQELAYIFAMQTTSPGTTLYAIDQGTNTVAGTSSGEHLGLTLAELGISPDKITAGRNGFFAMVKNQLCYCVFSPIDTVLVGSVRSVSSMIGTLNEHNALLGLYLIAVCALMIFLISKYLETQIIKGIETINHDLTEISTGKLDVRVDVNTTPEFQELSGHINQMFESLLTYTDKVSSALRISKVPMGFFDYNKNMTWMRYTSRVPEILNMSQQEADTALSTYPAFMQKLEELQRNPVPGEDFVFHINEMPLRFIKLESFHKDGNCFGLLIDVTREIEDKQRLARERDHDHLTSLLSRRAFEFQLAALFERPEKMHYAAIIMIDSDDLKQVNDRYGHQTGDQYLSSIAKLLMSLETENKLVSRLSGDEFAVVLYGFVSEDDLHSHIWALKHKRKLQTIRTDENITIPVRFSMGYALYPQEGTDRSALLRRADERMYFEKRKNKQESRDSF